MKLAIMQPYLFPYIGYFQLIKAVDKFVVYDDVNFIKKGWINKNCILIGGQKHCFTVPLKAASQNRLIKDIEVAIDDKWSEKFLRSIKQSYQKEKFFDETFDFVEQVICSGEKFISKMIGQSLHILKEKFDLPTEIVDSSTGYANAELSGQERILDICRREKASQYINPIGGIDLYNAEFFADNGIKLSFLQTSSVQYNQNISEFIPHLSIIDVLMFNGFAGTKNFLSCYNLV